MDERHPRLDEVLAERFGEHREHWAVRHPGIGILPYDNEREARFAAGTAGRVLYRAADDDAWAEAPP